MKTFQEVKDDPQEGDVIEFQEVTGPEVLIRVYAVKEGWVWFKEYGKAGRPALLLSLWKQRLGNAVNGKVLNVEFEV